jgi:hypothetical protein
MCGKFTAHTGRAVKKLKNFFLSIFIPLAPLSTEEVVVVYYEWMKRKKLEVPPVQN